MYKYLNEVTNYIQYKIIAGLIASIFTEDFLKLLLLFITLEVIDIFTRWLANSYHCYKAIYPNSPCGIYKALTFLWQARKWRYIKSTGLRDGFCDKMLLYCLLLLVGAVVDTAYTITKTPAILSSIITVVLASTEAMSVLENISEINDIAKNIKNKFKVKITK